ncbi:Polyamine aminopropyltransferase [Dyella sp. AD56]|uniref:fused MFS/spermidine synthase n=2 Tax=unclassified Dyella TaxID=2634549 RepID=UPI000CBBC6AB|nr:fused MFS/spermidine synthase [Dyella sp. AD56]PMQ04972.1 Polyamine aminopropyltransferase [Dyella sp. AD56]
MKPPRVGKQAFVATPAVSTTGVAPALLLFGSGAASLVYQLLWIKQLSLVVGVEVYAVTIAVSAFFAGLALGGAWFGRKADRLEHPLRLYAWLEGAVAVLGVAATFLLAHSTSLFATLEQQMGWLAWSLPFLLVGVPAVAMGGALPVLVRTAARDSVAGIGGRLYAANTAGAVFGVLAAPFLLLPALGVQGSAWVAAAVNVLAALVALALDRRLEPPPSMVANQGVTPQSARLALALYAIAGGIALGYEVVWSQTVVQFMSTRSFAFAMMLAVYLIGLMAGSAIYARFADRIRNGWAAFGVLIALAGFAALLQVSLLGDWLPTLQSQASNLVMSMTGSRLASMCARFATAASVIVLIPTLLLGAAFPAVLRLSARADNTGQSVGLALAFNTLGGIAGTALTGFLLVPTFGLVRSLALLAMLAALVGLVAVFVGSPQRGRARWAVAAVTVCSMVAAVLTPPQKLASLLTQNRGGEITYYEESRGGTVAVLAQGQGDHTFHRLYIQGVSNSGDTLPSLRYMRLQALLPLIIHRGEPHSGLVIGFGTGITAGALSQYPGLSTRVCAELLPAVVRAASQFQGNYGAGHDHGLDIRLRDGRRELLASEQRYDVITLEPPPPSAAGVVNLYSRDFYQLAARRLAPGGVLAQWWPLPTQNDEDSRAMVRAFLDAFPHATLWTTELHEMLLVGSNDPIELDATRIEQHFNQPSVAGALGEVGVSSPAALLATWVTDRAGLERYAGSTPPVTDDHPSIEYATWVRRNELVRVLPELVALRTEPPLRGASPELIEAMHRQRDVLFTFYASGLAAYQGDRDQWSEALGLVMQADGQNPYYRWIAGGGP